MKKLITALFIILLMPSSVSAVGIYEKNGKFGYNGHFYKGIYIPGILDVPLIDTIREIKYKLPAIYTKIEVLNLISNNEYVLVTTKDGKKSLFKNGKNLVPAGKYDDIEIVKYSNGKNSFENIFIKVKKSGSYGAIIPYIPVKYDELIFKDGYIITVLNNKKGLFTGNQFSDKAEQKLPEEYDNITESGNKNFIVTKNGKSGVYDLKEFIVPIEYDFIDTETAAVKKNELFGKYDKRFKKLILPLEYQNVEFYKAEESFDLYFITKNNKIGLARDDGDNMKIIAEPKYEKIFQHPACKTRFVTQIGNKQGMIEYNYSKEPQSDAIKIIIPLF